MMPLTPCSITSGTAPQRVAITGVPHAIDSIITRPNGSSHSIGKSVAVAPNREQIRRAVQNELDRQLAGFSIDVVDLLIDNIDFRPEFKAAIERKQIDLVLAMDTSNYANLQTLMAKTDAHSELRMLRS